MLELVLEQLIVSGSSIHPLLLVGRTCCGMSGQLMHARTTKNRLPFKKGTQTEHSTKSNKIDL